jgi:hypothetical protein
MFTLAFVPLGHGLSVNGREEKGGEEMERQRGEIECVRQGKRESEKETERESSGRTENLGWETIASEATLTL